MGIGLNGRPDDRVCRTQSPGGAVGRLEDGTPYFAPLGEMPYDPDEDRVQCHLCGMWFRAVGSAHLRQCGHGWTVAEYREAFHLLKQTPTLRTKRQQTTARPRPRSPHDRRAQIGQRVGKPAGTGGRGVRRSRSLAALRPDLVAELDPTRNVALDPYRIGVKSGTRLWWRCGRCGHRWQAAPHDRARGNGCPRCAQQRRNQMNSQVPRERSLAVKHPELLAELHPTKNPDLDPYALGAGSGQKVWWRCPACGHEWRAAPTTRTRGRGCPACGRRRTAAAVARNNARVPPKRSLAIRRPALAAELHPTRNPQCDPHTLAAHSNRVVWWLCPTCGNEWQAAPYARRRPGRCPNCRRS
jgi:rubrerythrin